MNRAYSLLTVKSVSEDQRIIRGVATTPEPDRMGDIVEPLGVTFKNPMPLLHQHDSEKPVGTVKFDKPTKDGITFEAQLPTITEPGPLKDRVDTAWGEVKAGLVRAVSIGFNALEYAFIEATGGIRYIESEVLELSLVTVPANAGATINQIKSIDAPVLAATGKEVKASDRPEPPGVTGKSKPVKLIKAKEANTVKKTIAEQISAFDDTRKVKAARMDTIMDEAAEKGETLNAEQKEEYDGLSSEVSEIDDHLKRLRVREKSAASTATVVNADNADNGSRSRSGIEVVKSSEKLAPGIRFARVVKCIGQAKGDLLLAERIAIKQYERDAVVVETIKAAVAAGTTGTGWGANLVNDTSVFGDFVEFLRPQTILGKFGTGGIPALRSVPFRVPLISETTGGAAYWTGEGKPKPLTTLGTSKTTLSPLKVATIAVCTMELLRDSSPSAETMVRDTLAGAVRERLDLDFIDPAKAASAGVSPASITNGVSVINSTGNDAAAVREDLRQLVAAFIAANNQLTSGVFIMSANTALALSLMYNSLDTGRTFPDITMNGGSLNGIPVITSEYVPSVTAGGYVILANAQDVYLADDGDVSVDVSREASLEMKDSSLTQDATAGTGTSLVSLWQTNSVGFLAERTINWAKRRSTAVQVLAEVNWGLPTGS